MIGGKKCVGRLEGRKEKRGEGGGELELGRWKRGGQ